MNAFNTAAKKTVSDFLAGVRLELGFAPAAAATYGIKQPLRGMGRAIWDAAAKLQEAGQVVTAATVAAVLPETFNKNNISIELSAWRKFNSLQA